LLAQREGQAGTEGESLGTPKSAHWCLACTPMLQFVLKKTSLG
jgi:hypothetical protein